MRILAIIIFTFIAFAGQAQIARALDDATALSGLTSVRAVYDVRTNDEKTLQFIFTVIRDTYDETVQQDVKTRYVVSMRGPTVKLLVRSRAGEAALQEKTVRLINELNQRGIRLEACGYALDLFGVEPEDLYQGIVSVGNSLNSVIGYQIKGYSLVSMN
jgi:intracellular sulfur oxidation DsrE/DsrF family protein